MRRIHALALISFLGAASSTLVACGSTNAQQCNASNCTGCCDSTGQCQTGITESACGSSGNACTVCTAGLFCQSGFCAPFNSGTGDGGGQTDAGNGDGGQGDGGQGDGGSDAGTDGGSGPCSVTSTLAFGSVATGDVATLTLTLVNPTGAATNAQVGDPFSPSGDHTAFVVTSQTGTIAIPPMESHTVSVVFSPAELRSYLAFMKVRPGTSCPDSTVTLSGSGVDSVLSWSPLQVDFGAVTPGVEVTRDVTFTNVSNADVTLSSVSASNAEFRVVTPGAAHVVPKNGTLMLTLGFKPAVLGPRQATLNFATSLSKPATGAISLKGFGGGPDISVMPAALAFGQVANNTTATASVNVANVGTQPPGSTLTLKLGQSASGMPPYVTITPMGATGASEFTATVASSYPTSGLTPGQSTTVTVAFTPSSSGMKSADLFIHSDDVDEPSTKVTLTGEGVAMLPCTYKVSTNTLNFGLVEPGQFLELGVVVTNTGTSMCTLSNLALTSSTSDFLLPTGTPVTATIASGASHEIRVRFVPTGTGSAVSSVSGSLSFNMSSSTAPTQTVVLTGAKGDSCLLTAPDEVDFGTVQTNCSSATRTISLNATCPSGISITGITMLNAAGQPSGGPNCPGASPCPEFTVVSSPSLPQTVFAGTPANFQVKYKAIDVGTDIGSVAINYTQNGQSTFVIVPLFGAGAATGQNTETLTVPTKADVVFVMDNSGSMGPYQTSFANASSSFFSYATTHAVDYRIGVTTTDNDPGGEQGRFIFGPTHPEKVLTPITANVITKFAAKVQPGTAGSGTEQMFAPMSQAVSYPLVVNDNAGFLREDSNLSFVLVTDEPDSSPYSVVYWANALRSARGWRNVNRVSFSAAANIYTVPPPGCAAPPDSGDYAQMIAQLGGATEIICSSSWSTTAQNLGNFAFGQRTRWYLRALPFNTSANPISVKVNGVTTTAWSYDAMSNAIVFNSTASAPKPGDTLTISYGVACL